MKFCPVVRALNLIAVLKTRQGAALPGRQHPNTRILALHKKHYGCFLVNRHSSGNGELYLVSESSIPTDSPLM